VEVKLGPRLIFTVEKADESSVTGKIGRASLTRKWTEFDKGVLLGLFEWDDMEAGDHFGTGLLAYAFGRTEEAEKRLLIAAKMDASSAGKIALIVAAKRGNEAGAVLLPYRGMWVTQEEKKYIDAGKELFKGKWMSSEEIMLAKGFILHEGRWLTQEEYEDATKEAPKLRALQKKLAPKGLIDKPGADAEQLEWSEARKYKSPWGNYMVEANLSEDAIKDIAYIMEVLQWNFRKIFRIRKSLPKYFIKIAKNKQEYDSDLGGGGLGKCGGGEISTFYQPPNTTMVLMHEGTHQIVRKFAPCCPVWWHEALATYFECSKFVVNPKTKTVDLKTGCVNRWRLGPIQREIKTGTYTPLRDHINGKIGGLKMYHQGWALSYYLINAKGGRYAARYFYFIQKHAGKGGTGRKKGQPEDKLVMRFMQALGIYDIDELEKEWKEYIMGLKLEEADDFNSGHR
jgi:hypothetical protein